VRKLRLIVKISKNIYFLLNEKQIAKKKKKKKEKNNLAGFDVDTWKSKIKLYFITME
jgi:hypothetical protein